MMGSRSRILSIGIAVAAMALPACRVSLLARNGPLEQMESRETVDLDLVPIATPGPGSPRLHATLYEVVRILPMLRNQDGDLAPDPFRSSYVERDRLPGAPFTGVIRVTGTEQPFEGHTDELGDLHLDFGVHRRFVLDGLDVSTPVEIVVRVADRAFTISIPPGDALAAWR